MIPDQQERQRALDPKYSFIVQAPAGSGKTELLIQRFLTLLAHVNHPEEIVAITFTKKSTAEMRDRIICALQDAATNQPVNTAHAKITRELALRALQKDALQHWNLLENPNRLRIQTIDSLNKGLARQLPILSHFGSSPELTDQAEFLYHEAIQELLNHLEYKNTWSDAIELLLKHMDNDLDKVEKLLVTLLRKRDQWLPYVTFNASSPHLRAQLESVLHSIITDTLKLLHDQFPKEHTEEMLSLSRIAADYLINEKSTSPIIRCRDLATLPGIQVHDKEIWLGLAKLLLTEQFEWRKKVDKTIGFPSESDAANTEEKNYRKEIKQRMKNLIERLCERDSRLCEERSDEATQVNTLDASFRWHDRSRLCKERSDEATQVNTLDASFRWHDRNRLCEERSDEAIQGNTSSGLPRRPSGSSQRREPHPLPTLFKRLSLTPNHCYTETQWELLASLHQVLKLAVAQLKLTFQKYGKVDYIENAHAALSALGTEDQPTDLALALDTKIQHILVDEFQDTSHSQFRLLEKLVMGWENNDGRTLFLVGDPMQSIYRFREAEVGLFIKARKNGIKNIRLEPLTLSVNFRSTSGIVDWINHHFPTVLAPRDDIGTGSVSFTASTAANTDLIDPDSATLHAFADGCDQNQAESIISIIQDIKKSEPESSIAILVKARAHLEYIIPALRKANIAYRAVDIDPLVARPVIQDLMALTKALLHPAHRVAWLTLLRAPWCGLTLKDLLVISQNQTNETINERLNNLSVIEQLSDDGKKRLNRIHPIILNSLEERRRLPLREWVENTWVSIGGPACLSQPSDLDDAATFFKLLEKLDEGSDLSNLDYLDEAVEKLFASPRTETDNTLQIMTIHNAKGLEFDVVILPRLESKSPHDDNPLLLWTEYSNTNDQTQWIIAPIHATGEENDTIYDYIKQQHAIKSDFESGRLLYVAATRAKKQLHLLFSLKQNNSGTISDPPADSLLKKLWPSIKNNLDYKINLGIGPEENQPTKPENRLQRLSSDWKNVFQLPNETIAAHQRSEGFLLRDDTAKYRGIVIHQILENMARHGISWWEKIPPHQKTSFIKKQLLQLGMPSQAIVMATGFILKAIQNTLSDSRGQWILNQSPGSFIGHASESLVSRASDVMPAKAGIQKRRSAPGLDPGLIAGSSFELAITTLINGQPQQYVIDRTFIDDSGTRWIIDYKSSQPADGMKLEDFIQHEVKKYEPQLQAYHEAMVTIDPRPTRAGLYFTMIPAWHEIQDKP